MMNDIEIDAFEDASTSVQVCQPEPTLVPASASSVMVVFAIQLSVIINTSSYDRPQNILSG
jgi:hypothetical protein